MITATDAKQLMEQGISQDEYLSSALDRTQAAIIDHSRRQLPHVRVAVYQLQEETLNKLIINLVDRGFIVSDKEYNPKASQITITW